MLDPNDGGPARVAPPGGRTWWDDRAMELERRSRGRLYRIIFPAGRIPILSLPALANNPWLGYHGLDRGQIRRPIRLEFTPKTGV